MLQETMNHRIDSYKSDFITTIACGVICENHNRILMVREYKEGKYVWNQPVGHLMPGETLEEAAKRETFEETGLKVKLVGLIGTYLWQVNTERAALRFCYLATTNDTELAPKDTDEIIHARWMSYDDLKNISTEFRTPITKRCLDDYFSGQIYPLKSATSITST